jgi:oxygen-dependent protoporphyrinogen oxidase
MTSRFDCIVVGGGLAGLVAAFDLAKNGQKVALFEASSILGGSIGNVELVGIQVDSGAESFAVSRSSTLELLGELGLSEKIVKPFRSDARILANGQSYIIPNGIMGIPSNLHDPEVFAILGVDATALAQELDAQPWNIGEERSVGAIVEKRMGRAVVEHIVNPVVAGVHSSDAYSIELNSILPQLLPRAKTLGSLHLAAKELRNVSGRPGSAVAGLRGGIYQMITALHARLLILGVEVFFNCKVADVRNDENDRAWHVTSTEGVFFATSVVIAIPPHRGAHVVLNYPELSQSLARVIAVDVAVVVLAVNAPELAAQPLGSGVLIAGESEGIHAKASTHASAKWKWLHDEVGQGVEIIRLSYGRNSVLPSDLNILKDFAIADVARLYGLAEPKIIDVKVVSWPKSLIQASVGHQDNLEKIRTEVGKIRGLRIVGAGLSGNGITGIIGKTREEIRLLDRESVGNE